MNLLSRDGEKWTKNFVEEPMRYVPLDLGNLVWLEVHADLVESTAFQITYTRLACTYGRNEEVLARRVELLPFFTGSSAAYLLAQVAKLALEVASVESEPIVS